MHRTLGFCLSMALFGCPGKGGTGSDTGPTTVTTTTGTTTQAQPPRAQDDRLTVEEGASASVTVSTNDLVGSNPLALATVTLVTQPANGTAVVQASGVVDYTHNGGEGAGDSFSYTIDDSLGNRSNEAAVTVTVTPVNDPPIAVDDADLVEQSGSVVLDLVANDVDPDDGLDLASIAIVDGPAFGVVSDNGDGTVDYDHDGTGVPYDSFTYTVSDLAGSVSNLATVELAVNTNNLPPTTVDDFFVVAEGAVVALAVTANDSDPDDGLNLGSIAILTQPANGVLTVNGDGTVDYAHDGGESAADGFTYRVFDNSAAPSNVAVVQVVITRVNDAPVAVDDAVVVEERATETVAVLGNDTDPDSPLAPGSVALMSSPAFGSALVNGNGTIDYTHDGSQVDSDEFSYVVNDTAGATSNIATVSVQIDLLNDPPQAADDAAAVSEGGVVQIDLAANDTDSDDAIDLGSIQVYTAPANGFVSIHANGTVDYTHNGAEAPSDSFTYTIDDQGGGTSNAATVSLTVSPVNDPPTAGNDSFVVAVGALNNTQNILSNDTDPDSALDPTSVVIVQQPANGSLAVNLNGTTTYDHDGSPTASDTYTYTVRDTAGLISNTATVNIAVTGSNDPPVAGDDTLVVAEGGAANVDVLTNDSDSDDGIDSTSTALVTPPANGNAVVQPDGSFDYTHNGSETVSDSFTYVVRDLAGLTSNEATVDVVVSPVNDPPTAVNDSLVVGEGGVALATVLANDTDPDSALDPASVSLVSLPAHGLAQVQVDGSVTYTHDGGEDSSDAFSYRVRDVEGLQSGTATVSVTIAGANDPPIALDDSGNAAEGGSVNVSVLANDTDVDDGLNAASVTVTAGPSNGSTQVLGDGSVTYTHNGSETVSDSFTYRVMDFSGGFDSAVVTLTINPVNDAPVAVADSASVPEGGQVDVAVLSNDSDPDDGLNPASVTVVSAPALGVATPQPSGAIRYVHNGSETLSDSFTYRVSDVAGALSNTVTVSLTVSPVNDPPVAVNDAASVNEGGFVTVSVLSNDSDPDNGLNPASVAVVANGANGSAVPQPNGSIVYTHNGSQTLSDSFTYRVSDASGAQSNTATVSLTVNAVNQPPTANSIGYLIDEGSTGNFLAVTGNDTDPDDGIDANTIQIVSPPAHGTYIVQYGAVFYDHDGSEDPYDSFTYRVSDYSGAPSNEAQVNLFIQPVNDPPVANDDLGYTVQDGGYQRIPVLANDTDPDDGINPYSIFVWNQPYYGYAVPGAPGEIDYYGYGGFANYTDSFSYAVSDYSGSQSNAGTVEVQILPAGAGPGALYMVRVGDWTLVRMDPNTLAVTVVGPLGVAFDFGELAWDSSTNTMYMVDGWSSNALYTVNLNTGAATLVGYHGQSNMFSLAYHPGINQLYGGGLNGEFYAIDRSNGQAFQLGTAPYALEGMTYDTLRGQLLATGYHTNLLHLDPYSGNVISVLSSYGSINDASLTHDPVNDLYWVTDWSGNLFRINPNAGYAWTHVVYNGTTYDGLAYAPMPGGGGLVGSFDVDDGPPYYTSPPALSCVEACAQLFGGSAGAYQCGTDPTGPNGQAYTTTYGIGGCQIYPDTYSVGGNYDSFGDVSAYVRDNCLYGQGINYCFH